MSVNLAMVLALSKKEALKYSSVNIKSIYMKEDGSALVFVLSDGTELSVPIVEPNRDSSSVFTGEGFPDVKANINDIYIDKVNKKIYTYDDYKWNFMCDIGVSNELINDISTLKSEIEKINKKISKLNVGLKIIE